MKEKPRPYYARPFVGQVFRRVENEMRAHEGVVIGVRTFGTFNRLDDEGKPEKTEDWTATIYCDGQGEHRFNCRERPAGPNAWLPLDGAELDLRYGPGYLKLQERIEALEVEGRELREVLSTLRGLLEAEAVSSQTSEAPAPFNGVDKTPGIPLTGEKAEQAVSLQGRRIRTGNAPPPQ